MKYETHVQALGRQEAQRLADEDYEDERAFSRATADREPLNVPRAAAFNAPLGAALGGILGSLRAKILNRGGGARNRAIHAGIGAALGATSLGGAAAGSSALVNHLNAGERELVRRLDSDPEFAASHRRDHDAVYGL